MNYSAKGSAIWLFLLAVVYAAINHEDLEPSILSSIEFDEVTTETFGFTAEYQIGWKKVIFCNEGHRSLTSAEIQFVGSQSDVFKLAPYAITIKITPSDVNDPEFDNLAVYGRICQNPIIALNNWRELSFEIDVNTLSWKGYANLINWYGKTEAAVNNLTNSCGDEAHSIDTDIYQACGKTGLHICGGLSDGDGSCEWTWESPRIGKTINVYFGFDQNKENVCDNQGNGQLLKLTPSPTVSPSPAPTSNPTPSPTSNPTASPTSEPTYEPTSAPTNEPTSYPTKDPTSYPTNEPTSYPTNNPSSNPTYYPTVIPTTRPTNNPISNPANDATKLPTTTSNTSTNISNVQTVQKTDHSLFIVGLTICIILGLILMLLCVLIFFKFLYKNNRKNENKGDEPQINIRVQSDASPSTRADSDDFAMTELPKAPSPNMNALTPPGLSEQDSLNMEGDDDLDDVNCIEIQETQSELNEEMYENPEGVKLRGDTVDGMNM